MAIENRDEVKALLKEKSSGGKISCAEARGLAEELGVPYGAVGKAANDLGIKIKSCELGCF